MRKQIYGRKLKRDKNERKALFSGLISAMVLKGRIKTTEQKAKAIRSDLEKIVTKAKNGEKDAKRKLQATLRNGELEKMINEIAPRFKNRPGGYTRIIKTGRRFSDNASMVIMEWVEGETVVVPANAESIKTKKPVGKATKKPVRKSTKSNAKARTSKKESK